MAWAAILIAAIAAVYAYSRIPKPQLAPPPSLDDLEAPTAEEGRSIPVLFGRRRIKSPNVVWYGDLNTTPVRQKVKGLLGSKYQNTGQYKVYLGMHMIIGVGPFDSIDKIEVGDKIAWEGFTTGGQIVINNNNLFGGDKKQGGIVGSVDIEMGLQDQLQNDYLLSVLGEDIPAYRGVVGVVLRHVYLGTTNYIKPWVFWGSRIHSRSDGTAQWYDLKSPIGALWTSPVAIYIAADTSISMGALTSNGQTRYENMRHGLWGLLDYIDSVRNTSGQQVFACVGRWSASDTFLSELPMDDSSVALFKSNIFPEGLTLSSGTDFNSAVNNAPTFFANPAIPSNAVRISLIVTDGEPNDTGLVGEASSTLLSISGLKAYAFNIDLENTEWTAYLDNQQQQIPVIDGSNPDGMQSAFRLALQVHPDMNPSHIIREALTDRKFALRYSDSQINDVSFMASADTLYLESMGISLYWTGENSIEEFIGEVLRHIDGNCYVDKRTGQWVLRLVRDDYDIEELPFLNEENIVSVKNYKQPTISELTNSITVVFWDSNTGNDASVTVQDPVLVDLQGGVINETIQYPGFTNHDIASRVAMRDLKAKSAPMISCTITCDRSAADLNIGDPFIFVWPDLNIGGIVMRVDSISLGDMEKAEIVIECVQDVFASSGLAGSSVVAPPGGGLWVDPHAGVPEPASPIIAMEAPYFFLVESVGKSDADSMISEDPGFGMSMVAAGRQGNEINARMLFDDGEGYEYIGDLDFAGWAEIEDLSRDQIKAYISGNSKDLSRISTPVLGSVRDEIVIIEELSEDSGGQYFTIGRGSLDTLPDVHEADSSGPVIIIAWGEYAESDEIKYTSGQTLNVKLLPRIGGDELSEDDAPIDSIEFDSRAARPYPPGNIRINGNYYPDEVELRLLTGDLLVEFANRNRHSTIDGPIDFYHGNVDPEDGTEYEWQLLSLPSSAEIISGDGITGTSFVMAPEVGGSVRFRFWSVRDGLESLDVFEHDFYLELDSTEAPIFVLAGQSNARGFGSTTGGLPPALSGPLDDCYIWNTDSETFEVYEATVNSDTLTSGASTPQAWGAEAEFFRQWQLAHPGVSVYLVKMGVDSSPMSPSGPEDSWLPSAGELFDDLTAFVADAKSELIAGGKTPVVRGVLFMQGEEDAEESSESSAYESNLESFIDEFRSSIGDSSTRFVIARILDRRTYSSVVRAAQENVADSDGLADWFDTDFYPQTSDTRHYTDPGLVALGYDFFHSYNETYPAAELPSPAFSNVKLLAGFNGANGATTYIEESAAARTATFNGNAQLSTADAIYGSAAALFDGTGDSITFPDSADWHMGSGAFVVQFSVKFNSLASSTTALINQWSSTGNQRSIAIDRPTASTIQLAYSTAGSVTVSAITPAFYPVVGQVYKFMFERDGSNNLRVFQNGIMIGKTTLSATLFDSDQPLRLGGLTGFSGYDLYGVLDEVRIIKGAFLHGSDERFSPNDAEFSRS